MRELVFGPRRSGRTTTLLMTMIEEMDMHDKDVYLVVSTPSLGMELRNNVKQLNGDPKRVKIIALGSLYVLQGIANPMNVYIEHTAYEQADSFQLQKLYTLEDNKDTYIGVRK